MGQDGVTALADLSFVLRYEPVSHLSLTPPDSVLLTPVVRNNYALQSRLVSDSGRVWVRLSRVGTGSFSGSGSLVRFRFMADGGTPAKTVARFRISRPYGRTVSGIPLRIEVSGCTALILPPFPCMKIAMAAKSAAQPGEMLSYEIRYWNAGTALATAVVVTDTLPPHSELASVSVPAYERPSDRVLRWKARDLAPGDSGVSTVVVRIADRDRFPGATLVLRSGVMVSCQEGYVATAFAETEVVGLPLQLGLQVEPKVVDLGQIVRIRCSWSRALSSGTVRVEPEGETFAVDGAISPGDTVFAFAPRVDGEHRVVFTGRDLTGGEEEALATFVVQVEEHFRLDRNRLNVAGGERVNISFGVGRSQRVRIAVYSVAGERVASLLNQQVPAGQHRLSWAGEDMSGREVCSGLYPIYLQ